MNFLVNLLNFLTLRFCSRHKVHRVQTHTVCTMQIDENRHNRTINYEFGGRTIGLQTFSLHYYALTRNTWCNTTSRTGHWVQPWSSPGNVRKYCGMYTRSNKHCNVRALSRKV